MIRGSTFTTNGPHSIAEFRAEYPRIKTGKGSIKFKATNVVPVPALEKVITHALEGGKQN